MSVVDDFLKKMKMVSDDDYDDYDDYDEEDDASVEEDDDEIISPRKSGLFSKKKARATEPDDLEEDDYDDEPVKKTEPVRSAYSAPRSNVVGMKSGSRGQSAEVCMILPKSFDDANTIADVLLSHKAVVLNLEGIDMAAAQRIIDFASGACYTVGGSLQKISKKIFIVVPRDMNLSGDFDEMIGDMIDLNSVNMMK